MIWIIGEYAERIDNADELLTTFLDGFSDENTQVQLQLLTAIVKLFLKRPTDTQELVQQVLSLATQDSDNPDLRDRGYIYWRLLSTDPAAAKVPFRMSEFFQLGQSFPLCLCDRGRNEGRLPAKAAQSSALTCYKINVLAYFSWLLIVRYRPV